MTYNKAYIKEINHENNKNNNTMYVCIYICIINLQTVLVNLEYNPLEFAKFAVKSHKYCQYNVSKKIFIYLYFTWC